MEMDHGGDCSHFTNSQLRKKEKKKEKKITQTGGCGSKGAHGCLRGVKLGAQTPTVVGAVPVLVPDGRAVGMGGPGHQPLLWDQASSALVVIFHH